jgi:hypothetical protein
MFVSSKLVVRRAAGNGTLSNLSAENPTRVVAPIEEEYVVCNYDLGFGMKAETCSYLLIKDVYVRIQWRRMIQKYSGMFRYILLNIRSGILGFVRVGRQTETDRRALRT